MRTFTLRVETDWPFCQELCPTCCSFVAHAREEKAKETLSGFVLNLNPGWGDREGTDYLGFGPIFPTGTKSIHDPVVGIQGMKHIRGLTTLPVFAIGGITTEAVGELCQAGANEVAVASGILDAVDRRQAFIQYLASFQ